MKASFACCQTSPSSTAPPKPKTAISGRCFLLLFSNSVKTREIVELTELARKLNPDMKKIVITGNPDSPLAQAADICLATGHPDEVCLLGMTPTTSTTVMTVIGDILVVETMRRTGFTIEEYSKRHHGGYLGERSRELSK